MSTLPANLGPPKDATRPAGFVLAGMHGSSGKTVLTCLLLAALEQRGLCVQPFKAGPDYIDPGYHNRYASRPSRNLDVWLMGRERVLAEAQRHTRTATGVLEGVMGLFDGADPISEEGSTMELARWLGWPVVLCVPAAKSGRSLAAGLRGFLAEAAPEGIAGVVLSGVSGSSHAEYLREALRPSGIPVLGAIPKLDSLEWPERHLGLQAAQERQLPSKADLAAIAGSTLDLDAITALALTHSNPVPNASEAALVAKEPRADCSPVSVVHRKVAIARDAAFHFYYQANLEWLETQGAKLLPFSPLFDQTIPTDAEAIVLGGGFPEVHATALSRNKPMLASLRTAVSDGIPCYAECGGLMLLSENIVDLDGGRFPMAGAIPGCVEMTRSLQNFGYCSVAQPGVLPAHGHEFHHSRWTGEAAHANAWDAVRRRTGVTRREGFRSGRLHASYVHLYFPALSPTLTSSLLHTP